MPMPSAPFKSMIGSFGRSPKRLHDLLVIVWNHFDLVHIIEEKKLSDFAKFALDISSGRGLRLHSFAESIPFYRSEG